MNLCWVELKMKDSFKTGCFASNMVTISRLKPIGKMQSFGVNIETKLKIKSIVCITEWLCFSCGSPFRRWDLCQLNLLPIESVTDQDMFFELRAIQACSRIIRYFSVTALTKSVPQDLSIPNAHSVLHTKRMHYRHGCIIAFLGAHCVVKIVVVYTFVRNNSPNLWTNTWYRMKPDILSYYIKKSREEREEEHTLFSSALSLDQLFPFQLTNSQGQRLVLIINRKPTCKH